MEKTEKYLCQRAVLWFNNAMEHVPDNQETAGVCPSCGCLAIIDQRTGDFLCSGCEAGLEQYGNTFISEGIPEVRAWHRWPSGFWEAVGRLEDALLLRKNLSEGEKILCIRTSEPARVEVHSLSASEKCLYGMDPVLSDEVLPSEHINCKCGSQDEPMPCSSCGSVVVRQGEHYRCVNCGQTRRADR